MCTSQKAIHAEVSGERLLRYNNKDMINVSLEFVNVPRTSKQLFF
jgi:hypothetical protein